MTVESYYAISIATPNKKSRTNFSIDEKQSQNQSHLAHTIFPSQVVGNWQEFRSRRLLLLWLLGQSFENRSRLFRSNRDWACVERNGTINSMTCHIFEMQNFDFVVVVSSYRSWLSAVLTCSKEWPLPLQAGSVLVKVSCFRWSLT